MNRLEIGTTKLRTLLYVTEIRVRALALSALLGIVVVMGCAGRSPNSSNTAVTPVTPITYTIGGSIGGLSGSGLVLQDNGGDNLSVSAGATGFTFPTAIGSGSNYSVNILSMPTNPSQWCVVGHGSGTAANANVTSVNVACVNDYTLGGTISGLSGTGLVLQDNTGNNLAVPSGATSFTFTTPNVSGPYSVTVLTQPSNPAQTCAVTNGSGTSTGANVTSVAVTCTNDHTVGGTISGLSGTGLVLQNNGGYGLRVSAGATSFTFATPSANGDAYSVTVLAQPSNPAQACEVANGSGTVSGANVTSVMVTCIASGSFLSTGSMTSARQSQTATLLNNGLVLIVGGFDFVSFNNVSYWATAELYNPATGTFAATGNMTTARYWQTATLLNNGQVLFVGGDNAPDAELYNPATGTFTSTGNTTTVRDLQTATLLNNGKVLIAGGGNFSSALFSAELYDPATGTFTSTGNMTTARELHTATLLNNGQVLIAGGDNGIDLLSSAELYDPATGIFTVTGSLTNSRRRPTATLLNNGQVLVAGGGFDFYGDSLASAELYDPTIGTFTATGNMTDFRQGNTATLLNDGLVLIAGGDDGLGAVSSADIYDPGSGLFYAAGSMTGFREQQTATLLNSGQVLVAGGDYGPSLASAELYLPATLTPTGLVSITVTPASPALSVGSNQQFVATGTFSNGSTQNLQSVTWSSSNQTTGTITNDASDHGVAHGLAAGTSTITASAGPISGSTVLTVH